MRNSSIVIDDFYYAMNAYDAERGYFMSRENNIQRGDIRVINDVVSMAYMVKKYFLKKDVVYWRKLEKIDLHGLDESLDDLDNVLKNHFTKKTNKQKTK